MNNNYGIQKNLGFALISFLTVNYLVFLIISFLKVAPGFLMQVILLLSFRNSPANLKELLVSPEFYLNTIAGLFILALTPKVLFALTKTITIAFKTSKLTKGLKFKKSASYLAITSSSTSEAFTAGIFHPQIYLSQKLVDRLSKKEFQAVYSHELYHKNQFDPLRSLLIIFAHRALPYYPFKKSLFESYEVLTELAADEFAANKTMSKVPIVSALLKLLETNNFNLGLSEFGFKNNRIEILVGNKFFKSKAFFSLLTFSILALVLNTVLVSNTDVFMQCQHLKECFDVLLHSNGTFQFSADNNICTLHAGNVIDHCISTFRK